MAAPLKPWERTGTLMNQSRPSMDPSMMGETVLPRIAVTEPLIQGANRPPVPPRLDAVTSFNPTMAGMNGMYSPPFMTGGYNNLLSSPYYHGFNYNAGDSSSFARLAESSAQGAFQSVESVVSAISSISMMLQSTYFALHNSFRAVIGVADQFSKLKLQLTELATSFAVFRILRWFYRRLLVLLKLRKAGLPDDAWSYAIKQSVQDAQQQFPTSQKSTWPLVLFFAITFGGPYLVWRTLRNLAGSDSKWADGSADHVVGECKFDFVGEREDELNVNAGQKIILAPAELQPRLRQNDWLLASVNSKIGVVPATYIKILGTRRGKPIDHQFSGDRETHEKGS